jgi:hypothetical protein
MSISYQSSRADQALAHTQDGAATVGAVAAGDWEGIWTLTKCKGKSWNPHELIRRRRYSSVTISLFVARILPL